MNMYINIYVHICPVRNSMCSAPRQTPQRCCALLRRWRRPEPVEATVSTRPSELQSLFLVNQIRHEPCMRTPVRLSIKDLCRILCPPLIWPYYPNIDCSSSENLVYSADARGRKDCINIRILHSVSKAKAQEKGIPETMVCRILMFTQSLGPLEARA